ncbi:hypothetical protein MKW92_010397, partial [Papaver armeniacum]
ETVYAVIFSLVLCIVAFDRHTKAATARSEGAKPSFIPCREMHGSFVQFLFPVLC